MAGVFALNLPEGLRRAAYRRERMAAFQRDLRAGVQPYMLVSRYAAFLHWSHPQFTACLEMLHRAGIGVFQDLQENASFMEIPVPVSPTAVNQVGWETENILASGKEAYLLFTLPKPQFVAGIQINFSYACPQGAAPVFRLFWREREQDDFTDDRRWVERDLPAGSAQLSLTIWVGGMVSQFRVHPDDKPCDFQISEVCLLVPKSS
jgi:hypothetical protein